MATEPEQIKQKITSAKLGDSSQFGEKESNDHSFWQTAILFAKENNKGWGENTAQIFKKNSPQKFLESNLPL